MSEAIKFCDNKVRQLQALCIFHAITQKVSNGFPNFPGHDLGCISL